MGGGGVSSDLMQHIFGIRVERSFFREHKDRKEDRKWRKGRETIHLAKSLAYSNFIVLK